jgi:dynein heavy chain
MDQPPVQVDNRMSFLGTFVQKTLKLKPEKWSRMMGTEDHKAVVMKFLERPQPIILVIVLTPTAQLVASNGFPLAQLKSKGVYFIKKALEPVSKTIPSESVITGDLSSKIIDQLASLVDEVFFRVLVCPLLKNIFSDTSSSFVELKKPRGMAFGYCKRRAKTCT